MTASTYGYFDDANKEYVVTTPFTPLPWINYLGNDGFFGLISNTSGGYSFYRDAKFRRITRYRYNNVPMDSGGRYFYINDNGTVWNPGGRPVRTELDHYECRHGMGYSKFIGRKNDIEVEQTTFIPLKDWCEVHRVTVTNQGAASKSVKLFSSLEWCLWNAEDDGANFQRNFSTGEVEVEGSAIYHKTEYRERRNHYSFFSVNAPLAGYDTDRQHFVGVYNDYSCPQAVMAGACTNSEAHGWSPVAAHQLDVELAAGESKTFVFVMGYVEVEPENKWQAPGVINKEPAQALMAKYDTAEKASAALKTLTDYWDGLLSRFTVKSGDERLDRALNIWNQYQNMVTFNMSRSASYFESGIGRGMGFRDSNQDTIGFAHMIPSAVRDRIIDLAATQQSDGSAYHQYQPLTKKGNADIGGNFNDDPMWLVLAVANYVKESGDVDFLSYVVPFEDTPEVPSTIYDHLKASFYHVVNNLGPHQLPLIGRADWNDCLNLNCFSTEPNESYQTTQRGDSDVAESLMIAGQFVLYGNEFIAIAKLLGLDSDADAAQPHVDAMVAAVKEHGWDGEWFLRAYDSQSNPIGSSNNAEGKIFIESQGFCTMAGIGFDDGKAKQALDSVEKHLACEYGVMLQQPAYSEYNPLYGEITSYPPGYKENAGIFCHNNPWIVVAEAMMGRADKALSYYTRITPAFIEHLTERHKTEPYVYSQMISGRDAYIQGEAKNSWLTGTAAWNYYAATQYILGIRPDYNGLQIDPCVDASLGDIKITRQFRDAVYHIEIKQGGGTGKGIASMTIDGVAVDGDVIDYQTFNGVHDIKVVLN
ncbi:glycosyl transferase [Neiella sp. HB171785]|uniref:Glycosyl transferase n=1 Tax=Neiella litorisoli TaxID=2771431 RepID=A0A8J6UGM6_9GAMM|nr:glycosyl transferase [Neiella litorisoli]MBD1390406.1 glycosyl transferase [Neiella litorisoli]